MSTAVHRSPNKLWRSNSIFKVTVARDFLLLVFFHQSVSPQPQSIPLGPFQIFSKIRGDIRKSRCTTGINDTGGKFATSFANGVQHRYQLYECCGSVPFFHFLDSNPDPSFHFDADPGRLFTLMRIRIKVMQICDNSSTDPPQLHFEHLYASIVSLHKLLNFDFDADPNLDLAFDLDDADPDPQDCL
jgi:hypothetical protein